MCILFIYTNPNPQSGGYRLIIASNRDEYYQRPARNAFFCSKDNIIGGRDMEPGREGGMWLGLGIQSPKIKFAALLNVTGEKKVPAAGGRGPLVFNYLKTKDNAQEFVKDLQTQSFTAFNLVMLEITKENSICYHHSNSPEATLEYRGSQILSFGNSTPDAPFTKVKNGEKIFQQIISDSQGKDELINKLLELLKCQDKHLPDTEMERRAPNGINFLSSIFVRFESGGYGTRTHSIVLIDDEGNVEFVEHTMKEPINSLNPEWEETVIKAHL